MRRLYIVAIIVAAAIVISLATTATVVSVIYYTDFEELPLEMVNLGGVCEQSDGVVTCSDNDMGTGFASYYLYKVNLSNLDRMWISTKARLPSAPNVSVDYGIALLSSDMNKVYIGVIDGYNGWVYILSWNVNAPNGWSNIGIYLTGRSNISNYDPTKWYIASLVYCVMPDAVHMYFQVNDTESNILAEAWASSYFSDGGFRPAYIGLVVDEGNATFDYLLAASAPTVFPVTVTETATETATVTETTTTPITVTETTTNTVTETATSTVTETATATVIETTTNTVIETVTETTTTPITVTSTVTETTTNTVTETTTNTVIETATATVTETTTTPVTVTETATNTVTSTATETATVIETTTTPITVTETTTETTTNTVTSPVYVHVYRTVSETVTAVPATAVGIDKFAIAVAILIMVATVVFVLRR
jgi:hypothetical protein